MMKFLDMGGYYPWVWPSYAVVFAALWLNIYWAKRLMRRARQAAQRRLEMQEEK